MKRVILHIGVYKTGTTAIQHLFPKSNRKTIGRLGWYIPETGAHPSAGGAFHHGIARCLQNSSSENSVEQHFVELKSEIKNSLCETVFLSTELFCSLPKNLIQRLSDELSDFDIEILVYVRRQDELLHSLYLTSIWYEESQNSDPPAAARVLNSKIYFADYSTMLKNWREAFPSAKFHVRIYDQKKLGDGVAADFLNAVGLDYNHFQTQLADRVNVHLPSELIEFVRLMNIRGRLPVEKHRYLITALRRITTMDDPPLTLTRRWFISTSKRLEILDRYRRSNEEFARDWFPKKHRSVFSFEMPKSVGDFAPVNLSCEEVTAITLVLWHNHGQELVSQSDFRKLLDQIDRHENSE